MIIIRKLTFITIVFLFLSSNIYAEDTISDIDIKNAKLISDLVESVLNNDLEGVKESIKNGADVNTYLVKSKSFPIIEASKIGDIDIVKELVENGANVNVEDDREGVSALMYASKNGHLEVVKYLIMNGSAMYAISNKSTSFSLATENGHNDIAMYIKDISTFIDSAKNGDYNQVKKFIEKGIPVDALVDFDTALAVASENGHIKIVKYLIDNGANVNGDRPYLGIVAPALSIASQNGHLKIVKILIKNGAKVNLDNTLGGTALMSASENGYVEIVKLLIDNGADVNVQTDRSSTALIMSKNYKVSKILIDNGADIKVYNDLGYTALYGVTDIKLAKLLIDKGADLNATLVNDGSTPLIEAVRNNNFKIVKLLVESGADMSIEDYEEMTVLQIACNLERKEICNYLKKPLN